MSVEVDATEVYKALREVKANVQRVESPALERLGSTLKKSYDKTHLTGMERSQTVNVVRICKNMLRTMWLQAR